MEHIWKPFGFIGLAILDMCTGHPIPYIKDAVLQTEVPSALLAVAVLLVSVVCLIACVCCRDSHRKGFKPDKEEKEKEFRDSTPSLHQGLSFTNPGLSAGSELAIFPPPGVPAPTSVSVTFEPLPVTLLHARRPPGCYAAATALSDADWFVKPDADFPRQQLQYLREHGRGWFGRVVEGEAQGLAETKHKVMVRMLREDATPAEQRLFLSEAKPYRDLKHTNVLKMVGRCLDTSPYLILLEACSAGDLKSFLCGNLASRNVLCEDGVCLRIMCQVAAGLQHMINNGFVHTDLAARNCLVTSDLTVKVGDYGTSIETYKEDYYIAGEVAVPVRWCAPETLYCTDTTIETKQVTAEANVWSLGVLLWEVCQFGKMPYSQLTDDQVIVRVLGGEGLRLAPPSLHPLHASALYSLMSLCWRPPADRASLDHLLSMLNHLHSSHSEEDFQRRWEALRPNTITPEIHLETLTARSDFDSGVDLEIKSVDREVLDLVKKSSSDVNMSPSTVSPQLSVASSSGGEFFSQTNLSVTKKQLSPSLTNLHGSVEDISKPTEEEKKDNTKGETEEFDSWLKGVDTTNEEDVKFVKRISEAIKDLDDALALEKTSSSSDDSSRHESPLKDFNAKDDNPVIDFRLGPINEMRRGRINPEPDSLQDDRLERRDSSGTDTEDETWRGRIERGEFSEKVKEKSKSVTDLMILTHIESESSESDSLPSLTRQYSGDKNRRKSGAMMSTIGFGSEGNIRGAVLGEKFQDALKQLQAEWKLRDMESRDNSLQMIKNDDQDSQHNDNLNFLCNDASENPLPLSNLVTKISSVKKPNICTDNLPQTSVLEIVNNKITASSSSPNDEVTYTTVSKIHSQCNEQQDSTPKMNDNQESVLSLNVLSPEITEISDSSQITESSSEISTPTQYEVVTHLEHVQLFLISEQEHSSSLSTNLMEVKPVDKSKPEHPSSCDIETFRNPDESVNSVKQVPNVFDVINCTEITKIDSEKLQSRCDKLLKDMSDVNIENVLKNSANSCIDKGISTDTTDIYVPVHNEHSIVDKGTNNLLSNSATKEVLIPNNSLVFTPKNSEINEVCSHNSNDFCESVSLKTPAFLLNSKEHENNCCIPEILVTEASILDTESDSEPEFVLPNTSRSRGSVRIVMSSSDNSDEDANDLLDEFNMSDKLAFMPNNAITSTPLDRGCKVLHLNESVSDVDPTFLESTKSDSFYVPFKIEHQGSNINNGETSVILGSCEDYTLDYFKGLKTTFGKHTSDESTDEFSKSEGEEEEKKEPSINQWDEFLTNALQQRYQENITSSDIEFETSDMDSKFNNKNREVITQLCDSSHHNIDILEPSVMIEKTYADHSNCDLTKNVMICDEIDIIEGISGKPNYKYHDHQMEEVKSRLEDVAMFSESFQLKNQNTTMDDDEDGKLLTPDDERSSDSGFRDKGSLSESVEDACDEKYNLEDIEAELEEQFGRQSEGKPTHIDTTFVIRQGDEGMSELDLTSSTIKADSFSEKGEETDEIVCLSSDDKQERLNKLDDALDSNIDVYFETGSSSKSGWYLHPPPGTLAAETQTMTSGWLPSAPEEGKDASYVSFDIDEEFVTAIRNELRDKLPCAQNPEKTDNEEDISPEEERADIVIQYNTYPAPLSPIFEDRESISSNQSSLLLDETGKSIESSGKSSPILYFTSKEDDNLSRFEDEIRSALDVCISESTESDNVLVTVEDLDSLNNVEVRKVVESPKDEMDDLLVVDTETNIVTLLESDKPKSQLAFVKQVVDPVENGSPVESATFTLYLPVDGNPPSVDRNNQSYTSDNVSPLSSGSSRTGVAISFSSSETGGNLSGFYLSPSSVRSDLLDNGPPSLPFDLGQIYEPVEEIKPNNEANEILQELVDAGVINEDYLQGVSESSSEVLNCGLKNSKETPYDDSQNLKSDVSENATEDQGSSLDSLAMKSGNSKSLDLTDKSVSDSIQILSTSPKSSCIKSCDKIDEMLSSATRQVQLNKTNEVQCKAGDSQDWLRSLLMSNTNSNSIPSLTSEDRKEVLLISLNTDGWPTSEELMAQPTLPLKGEPQVSVTTPESPNIDMLEVAAKFYDVHSTLAISTPNNVSFDESKDNSQLSSFTSTPTLETVKCITTSLKQELALSNEPKDTNNSMKSIPMLRNLASEIVLRFPLSENVANDDSSPDDSERSRRLQGMTLALEPSPASKAPMPSPEDADKGAWRPTMGQLMELTNQPEQDDMMTTSFIDADTNEYAPDWESDTSDDSEDHSSSSGEFVWRGGDRETAVHVIIACDESEPQDGASETTMARISEGEEEDEEGEGEDNSSCGSLTEFIPSIWDSTATPTKSALRSAEKPKTEKRNVIFKKQKYHCVYEYPREPSDSEEEEDLSILQRRSWQSPSTFDYSTYADWEYGDGEVAEGDVESDSEETPDSQNIPDSEYDFYRLSNLDFDSMTQMNLDDGEFFISSSARPFQYQMGDSSQFFPGSISDDDFLVEFRPCASDTNGLQPAPHPTSLDDSITGNLKEVRAEEKEKQKPTDLCIVAESAAVTADLSSAEVSPTLGELRHTRPRLKLDLGRGEVRGEASLLDSGGEGEDSGVESTATGSSDRLDQVQASEA